MRDLADWAIRMAERGNTGVFNTVGPAEPFNLKELLTSLASSFGITPQLRWVPASWLHEQKVSDWSNLLFWPTQAPDANLINAEARAWGLTFRPLSVTATDTVAWYRKLSAERRATALLGLDGQDTIDSSLAREQRLLAQWHADAVRA